ncbi:unnamed protein product [Rotaria sordida]|uniref:Uncharacterized protein n=1 Tax=Rotaria sordida TaxID=392033 RepID=A0A815GSF6_9BILA|nr:unnamed protein product [Rotaria sordida]CAF1342442.1 unnamed protein product [Rotaria sordida]CAF3480972.1 unnamed protein product [Rotaria sordida]CAF3638608.1 unnamed protein product [Rotaria sordida]
MIAEKNQSAIIRVISTMYTPQSMTANKTYISQFLIGQIKRDTSHTHSQDSLYVTTNGAHTHNISNPGYDHEGQTGSVKYGPSGWKMKVSGYDNAQLDRIHFISLNFTGIIIQSAGDHSQTVLWRN